MKDLLILVILGLTALWALRSPWVGIMGWTMTSLGSPHVEFGYASAWWPVGTVYAVATLIGLLATKEKWNPMIGSPPWWLLAFGIWLCVTLPFSMFFTPSYPLWERTMKTFLMLFVTLALLTDKHKLTVFIWINVLAIAFYGVKGGVFTLASGGNYRVWGPGGFIEGNNEVGLAVITVIPLMRYLHLQMTSAKAKLIMLGAILLCVATVLGTHSRGALLGVAAMGVVLWWRGQSKVMWGVLIVALVVLALPMMPEHWWQRMGTIKTYDADESALGRINAWWMAFNLAKANFFGGGFMIYNPITFAKYAPVPDDVHAAHSIYFQVLGEHGFLGLFLFMAIGAATWWTARDLMRSAKGRPQLKWAGDLGAMIQVSMVGYGVTGAFLSLTYYDLPYNIMVMAVIAQRLVAMEMRSEVAKPVAAAAASARALAAGKPSVAHSRQGP